MQFPGDVFACVSPNCTRSSSGERFNLTRFGCATVGSSSAPAQLGLSVRRAVFLVRRCVIEFVASSRFRNDY
jgi:hypothetical protein